MAKLTSYDKTDLKGQTLFYMKKLNLFDEIDFIGRN